MAAIGSLGLGAGLVLALFAFYGIVRAFAVRDRATHPELFQLVLTGFLSMEFIGVVVMLVSLIVIGRAR